MKITVQTHIDEPIATVWACWTTPEHIIRWNAASDDWHTTTAQVDLRPGGAFSSRMEAKDGSMGFDFAGHYTRIETPDLIEAEFGERTMQITFTAENGGVRVRETFDPETDHSVEAQKAGWQAILDNFKKYVELTI